MNEQEIHQKHVKLLQELKLIINKTCARVICSEPDILFEENIIFFTKSFLISICTYLESYLKDIAFSHINVVNDRLVNISIPYNLIKWNILYPKEITDRDLKFENMKISIKAKDLDDHISASPHRTESLFKKIGIDLTTVDGFLIKRELIKTIVLKRNNIIHHNDNANDISMIDLILYIDYFIEYMEIITQVVKIENAK